MKRSYLFLASAALLMAGCSDDSELTNVTPQYSMGGIVFNTQTPASVRATLSGSAAAEKLNNEFVVFGTKTTSGDGATSSNVFNNYVVTYKANSAGTTSSNSSNWEYVGESSYIADKVSPTNATSKNSKNQTIKYWDYSTDHYGFTAFSGKTFLAANGAKVEKKANSYEVTIPSGTSIDDIYFSDSVVVKKTDGYNTPVVLTFRNFKSKIRVGFYETVPGYSVKIDSFYYDKDANAVVTSYKAMDAASSDKFVAALQNVNSAAKADGADKSNVVTVTYATGANANQPQVSTGSSVNYQYTLTLGDSLKDKTLGESAANATWTDNDENTDHYVSVYPNPDVKQPMLIRCDYTLTSLDGKETIKVKNARVVVPAQYVQWKSNYAYTYLFKISNNSNGTTGTTPTDPDKPGDNDDPEGLYPITFDAVVEQASDYTQETVSTFATNTVTTYAEKSNVVTNNEYKKDATVYFVTSTTTGSEAKSVLAPEGVTAEKAKNATVYKLSDKDSYSEAELLAQLTGSKMGITTTAVSGVETCTTVPSADGTTLSLSGVKATLSEAGTYAYVYCTTPYAAPTYAAASSSSSSWVSGTTYYYKTTDDNGVYYVASGITAANFDSYKSSLYTQISKGTAGVYTVKIVKVVK